MFEFLRVHQVDIMLALSSICLIIAFFTLISTIMTKRRRNILLLLELGAAIWLEADRVAYIYRGIPGHAGYLAVKISNFFVFLMTVFVLTMVNFYIDDALRNEGGLTYTPGILKLADIMGGVAMALVVISQFTGLYYIIDENNEYQRSSLYFVSYIFPYLILLIQFAVLIYYRKKLKGRIAFSIFMFSAVCLLSSMIQLFFYGVSLVDMAAVVMVIGLYVFALVDMNERVERANRIEISQLKGEHDTMRRLFDQTASSLVTAIDAKDLFNRGHSVRVAEYAKEIARLAGMDEKKCDEVYFAGLLHDVGKLGVKDTILQKNDSLDPGEYDEIKKHTVIGGEILSNIEEFPFLSVGAKYHHERYDGKGYPEGLVGENIPEIARILAVADTYDSMTSNRRYRDPMPQSTVREEIVKGAGTQLDPKFSEIMVDMIDHDTEYMMREKEYFAAISDGVDINSVKAMHFGEYKENISEGIQLGKKKTLISFDYQAELGFDEKKSLPAIILFDSHDGCVHKDDRGIRLLEYLEYGEVWMDGNIIDTAARDMKVDVSGFGSSASEDKKGIIHYEIEAEKIRDHARLLITGNGRRIEVIAALPDAARFCYTAFSGEHCYIMNVQISEGEEVGENYIPRIAEEVSYINRIEGDIPNVQIEGYRLAYTESVPVVDGMRLRFRTMSLPTANLIWHCAFILLFSSDDGLPEGRGYLEHGCIRLDGEDATNNDLAVNQVEVHKNEDFKGWDTWKKENKKGYECEVSFTRRKNRIIMATKNAGITLKSVTSIPPGYENVRMALTGDQCALTDIRVLL